MACAPDKQSYTVHTQGDSGGQLGFVCDAKDKKSEGVGGGLQFTCEDPAVICGSLTTCTEDCNFK